MEEGLFSKYLKTLRERNTAKEEVIAATLEKTGIRLDESELSISKTQITLSTSSVKKTTLFQKGMKEAVEEIGYTLKN